VPPSPPSRCRLLRLLAATFFLAPACAGQDLARREGVHFRGSRLASFRELPVDDLLYQSSLGDALALTGIPRERVARLPRVVRGTSFLVDPPYLGRTAYSDETIFVWDGTEVPLRLVLTHEMIHWVLFQSGEPGLATDEALVERLCASIDAAPTDDPVADAWPASGDRAAQTRWYDLDVSERNRERRRRGITGRDEPDTWALVHERARSSVPQHPD